MANNRELCKITGAACVCALLSLIAPAAPSARLFLVAFYYVRLLLFLMDHLGPVVTRGYAGKIDLFLRDSRNSLPHLCLDPLRGRKNHNYH